MGFLPVLFLILLVLQLTGLIAISWWWVFSPLLLAVAIFLLLIPVQFWLFWIASRNGENLDDYNIFRRARRR